MAWYKLLTLLAMFCLIDSVYLLPALPCPGKDTDTQLTSSAPFSHSSQEQLTPMDFSFVACAQSMHLLLLPRRGPWISTFLYVCVCLSTSFVFTNLSPLPALAKPQCPPACLYHSLSFSFPCLVCNSPACSSPPSCSLSLRQQE